MGTQCIQLLSEASQIIFLCGALFGALSVGIVVAIAFSVKP